MRYRNAAIPLSLLGWLAFLGAAHGQGFRTYEPTKPTVSPYLNLLRTNFGPLPNYQSLVRPQLRQQSFNQSASRAIEYNLRQVATLERSVPPQRQGRIRVRSAPMRPTGVAGQFQYFSHYFPIRQTPRTRR